MSVIPDGFDWTYHTSLDSPAVALCDRHDVPCTQVHVAPVHVIPDTVPEPESKEMAATSVCPVPFVVTGHDVPLLTWAQLVVFDRVIELLPEPAEPPTPNSGRFFCPYPIQRHVDNANDTLSDFMSVDGVRDYSRQLSRRRSDYTY